MKSVDGKSLYKMRYCGYKTICLIKSYDRLDYLVVIKFLIIACAVLMEKLLDYIGKILRKCLPYLGTCLLYTSFQPGGKLLREINNIRVESLAIIDNIDNGVITFRD